MSNEAKVKETIARAEKNGFIYRNDITNGIEFGQTFVHPKTKAEIHIYPDGSFSRDKEIRADYYFSSREYNRVEKEKREIALERAREEKRREEEYKAEKPIGLSDKEIAEICRKCHIYIGDIEDAWVEESGVEIREGRRVAYANYTVYTRREDAEPDETGEAACHDPITVFFYRDPKTPETIRAEDAF